MTKQSNNKKFTVIHQTKESKICTEIQVDFYVLITKTTPNKLVMFSMKKSDSGRKQWFGLFFGGSDILFESRQKYLWFIRRSKRKWGSKRKTIATSNREKMEEHCWANMPMSPKKICPNILVHNSETLQNLVLSDPSGQASKEVSKSWDWAVHSVASASQLLSKQPFLGPYMKSLSWCLFYLGAWNISIFEWQRTSDEQNQEQSGLLKKGQEGEAQSGQDES